MLRVHTFTHAGKDGNNEDALLVQSHPLDPSTLLIAIADGMAGGAGGFAAANAVVQAAVYAASQMPISRLQSPRAWATILRRVDRELATSDLGFTTLLGMSIRNDELQGASAGDSAALLHCQGRVLDLTFNQCPSPIVGSGDAIFRAFEAKLVRPWSVLLMTDGVWQKTSLGEATELFTRTSNSAVIDVLKRAQRPGGVGPFPSDFTIVLVES